MLVAGARADSLPFQIPQPRLHVGRLDLRRELIRVAEEGDDNPLLVPQQVLAALTIGGRSRGPERDGAPERDLIWLRSGSDLNSNLWPEGYTTDVFVYPAGEIARISLILNVVSLLV